MTALLCALALAVAPGSLCERGGHATHEPYMERGGRAVLVDPPVRLLRRFRAWICIHDHEGAWNDRGDPYWGGLQMDRGFMAAYGGDMIRRHDGGLADTWSPAEQITVAERAYVSGRGFAPWPMTRRACRV